MRVNIIDSTDWPVDNSYVAAIESVGVKTGFRSRWLNAVAVTASKNKLKEIESLPFVKNIQPMQYFTGKPAGNEVPVAVDNELLDAQIQSLQGGEFISRGINGKGIRIAVFDGGFPGVDNSPVLSISDKITRL
ncbi:MAG: hypothetical protein HC830_11310 [Bacteroidetes bacterium]|nr:hypothetical protein [Bacteroidota bacterium]